MRAVVLVASLALAPACRDAAPREEPRRLLAAPDAGLGRGPVLDGGPMLLPLGAAGHDPARYRAAIEELERRCLDGDRGSACSMAASTFEEGNGDVRKDLARALACYRAGCSNRASSHLHDVEWHCQGAARLADAATR